MNTEEILKFCLENGLLVDKEVLNLFSETSDTESVKMIIGKIKNQTHQRLITKEIFAKNQDLEKIFLMLPKENQKNLEKLKIKMGLSIEISKEISNEIEFPEIKKEVEKEPPKESFKVTIESVTPLFKKKPAVEDFVNYFKARLIEMRTYLQAHSDLKNLVSIDKISGDRQGISIIGLVSDKRITKNKNIIFEIEDLTGKVKLLVNQNKPDLYKKAEEISLDSVIGARVSGNKEIVFANDIIFPDSFLAERKKSQKEEYALFLSDLQIGSKSFLENNFLKFIDYINGKLPNTPEVSKIKYLFIVGDLIAGVGIYPKQEKDLVFNNLEEQFLKAAELLAMIRKDIAIIISPGNHDCVRLMEPQPTFDEKYAWALFDLENVFLTGNPSYVNIGKEKNFEGFEVLTYHGDSFPFFADSIQKLAEEDALNHPEKIMAYVLKNRHLAPTHTSVQYIPSETDNLIIKKIPDIFLTGHLHKSAVTYYNNILIVSGSCWESKTLYQEKMGNKPDFCKVPMLNLMTRQVKILDFE